MPEDAVELYNHIDSQGMRTEQRLVRIESRIKKIEERLDRLWNWLANRAI